MALPPPSDTTQVVVTGAASGIGREVARQLAQLGYHLTLVDVQQAVNDTAAELRQHVDVDVHVLDLTDAPARTAFIEAVAAGPRDVVGVCNVAGLITVGRFDKQPPLRERILVDVSVSALHHLSGAFLPGMQQRGAGAILNVSSPGGVAGMPYLASYSAAKGFVMYFSTALHEELRGSGVSCTTLMPAITNTPLAHGIEYTGVTPSWFWRLPIVHQPEDTARRGINGMLAGKRWVTAGPDAWLVSVLPRFVPLRPMQRVIRLAGGFAFPAKAPAPNSLRGRLARARNNGHTTAQATVPSRRGP